MFCDPDGEKYPQVGRKLIPIARRAGLTNVTPHTLRHSFASWLVMKGVDLGTVQKLLGHADITMTMVYAHLAPDHIKAAVERLDFSNGHSMDTNAVQDAS